MIWLGRLVVVVWLVFMALIGSTLLVGRAKERSHKVQQFGFDYCASYPCFMGLIPDYTHWKSVNDTLSRLDYETVDFYEHTAPLEIGFYTPEQLSISVQEHKHFIRIILVGIYYGEPNTTPNYLRLTAGEFIEFFGQPCALSVGLPGDPTDYYLQFLYPYIAVNFDVTRNQIDEPIYTLQIRDVKLFNSNPNASIQNRITCQEATWPDLSFTGFDPNGYYQHWQGNHTVHQYFEKLLGQLDAHGNHQKSEFYRSQLEQAKEQ